MLAAKEKAKAWITMSSGTLQHGKRDKMWVVSRRLGMCGATATCHNVWFEQQS
jgi:hypothetical protein